MAFTRHPNKAAAIGRTRLMVLAGLLSGIAPPTTATSQDPQHGGCRGHGALTARLRGAVDQDITWQDAQMRCEGSMRPDGSGLRLSAVGPLPEPQRSLRLLLGIAGAKPGLNGRNLPANLTLIVGEPGRIYATRGAEACTVDSLQQRPLATDTRGQPRWQVEARGFCITPARAANGAQRILLSRFDLRTELVLDPTEAPVRPAAQ